MKEEYQTEASRAENPTDSPEMLLEKGSK